MLTDQPVDLSRFDVLLETILARFRPETDLFVFDKTSHDTLDYTSGKLNHGSKALLMGVGDPIRELPYEYTEGPIAEIDDIAVYCKGCLVVSGADYAADTELASKVLDASPRRERAGR